MGSSEGLGPVPFSVVLARILEPRGYRLRKIVGKFRFFDREGPAGASTRRIGFPVERGMVEREYVDQIIKILDEDTAQAGD